MGPSRFLSQDPILVILFPSRHLTGLHCLPFTLNELLSALSLWTSLTHMFTRLASL